MPIIINKGGGKIGEAATAKPGTNGEVILNQVTWVLGPKDFTNHVADVVSLDSDAWSGRFKIVKISGSGTTVTVRPQS